jgi:predicted SAM-dependent methyltransferase
MNEPENYFQRPDFARYSKQLSDWVKLSTLRGLEIGPLDKPLLPKAKYDVKYLDVFPLEKLVARCKPNPNRNENQIVPLDYVIGDSSISEVLDQQFDYVVASHVIEHLPNLFGWLRDLAKILSTNGKLFLVVPDRRFTFDMMRPQSSLGELIENDRNQLKKPSFRSVFDQRYYHRQASSHDVWQARQKGEQLQIHPSFNVRNAFEFAQRSDSEHLDVHCNVFEPDSFTELVDGSFELGIQPFNRIAMEPTTPPFLDFMALLQL